MLYRLKILCLLADEGEALSVCEPEQAGESRCEWTSTFTNPHGFPDTVVIIRIRASWSSRG